MFSRKRKSIFNKWFELFDDSTGYIDSLSRPQKEKYKKELFRKLRNKLKLESQVGRRYSFPTIQLPERPCLIYRVAAVLILCSFISVGLVCLNGGLKNYTSEKIAELKQSTPIGKISTFVLPDGSKIWLSTASTLYFPKKFIGKKRTVRLQGEAFFDIMHDSDHPFIVQTGTIQTRVLGTSFDIKAYPEDSETAVTLVTGRIEVQGGKKTQRKVLQPNEKIIYNREYGLGAIQKVDASLEKAWMEKELVFIRKSFATIAKTFERWYGVKFIFKDTSLKKEVFVYHFKELSLERSMQILSKLADFSYKITGKSVIIRSVKNNYRKPGEIE